MLVFVALYRKSMFITRLLKPSCIRSLVSFILRGGHFVILFMSLSWLLSKRRQGLCTCRWKWCRWRQKWCCWMQKWCCWMQKWCRWMQKWCRTMQSDVAQCKVMSHNAKVMLLNAEVISHNAKPQMVVFLKAFFLFCWPDNKEHQMDLVTFKKPAYCYECGGLLWGLKSQGMRCSGKWCFVPQGP